MNGCIGNKIWVAPRRSSRHGLAMFQLISSLAALGLLLIGGVGFLQLGNRPPKVVADPLVAGPPTSPANEEGDPEASVPPIFPIQREDGLQNPRLDPQQLRNDPVFQEIRQTVLDATQLPGPSAPLRLPSDRDFGNLGTTHLPTASSKWLAAELILRSARLLEEDRSNQAPSSPLYQDRNVRSIQQLRQIATEILLSGQ